MHREEARKRRSAARITAGVLALAAGGLFLAPAPNLAGGGLVQSGGTPPPDTAAAPTQSAFDIARATSALKAAGPEPRPQPVEPEVVAEAPPEPDQVATTIQEQPVQAAAEPAPEPSVLRYVGAVVGPRRTMAMLAIDGQKHVVPEGGEFRGRRLVSVKADHVVFEDTTGQQRIAMDAISVDWAIDRTGMGQVNGGMGAMPLGRRTAPQVSRPDLARPEYMNRPEYAPPDGSQDFQQAEGEGMEGADWMEKNRQELERLSRGVDPSGTVPGQPGAAGARPPARVAPSVGPARRPTRPPTPKPVTPPPARKQPGEQISLLALPSTPVAFVTGLSWTVDARADGAGAPA